MHKDTKEALERLEAELLQGAPELSEEELDALLESYLEEDTGVYADPPGYQNFANGYQVRNNDDSDVDLEVYSDQVYEEPEEAGLGAGVLPILSLLGAAAALIYILLRLL